MLASRYWNGPAVSTGRRAVADPGRAPPSMFSARALFGFQPQACGCAPGGRRGGAGPAGVAEAAVTSAASGWGPRRGDPVSFPSWFSAGAPRAAPALSWKRSAFTPVNLFLL